MSWFLLIGGGATARASPLLKKIVAPNAGNDVLIVSGVAVLPTGAALLASWFPARRAALDDPLRAIGQR
ncbi:MAG: hypothetical protein M3032_05560 [Verrucomicrobiota bacterium]|nr:hypothetical protein [Verrucomicrobiota bacterium]